MALTSDTRCMSSSVRLPFGMEVCHSEDFIQQPLPYGNLLPGLLRPFLEAKRVSSDPQRFAERARVVSQWSEGTQQVRPFGLSQIVHVDFWMDCWMSMCCLPGAGVLLLQEVVSPHQF